uniref:RING-type E3 ubiquitin transferase n=1 Tax=Chelonoidis abingdonii TaxID=106734 RepID=A0A8C0QQV8_CHEAB
MAAGDLAGSFQDEVTCAVCLEYFTDPVTVECGHNFCRACISQCWGESEPDFSCPQCRETAQQRNLRPNRQLGNLVELVKRLRLQAVAEPKGQQVCERHQEALKLFCEEDQTPICVVCDRSRAHRAHTVVPIEEAAQEYRVGNSYCHGWELLGQLLCGYRAPNVAGVRVKQGEICADPRVCVSDISSDALVWFGQHHLPRPDLQLNLLLVQK